MLFGDLFIGFYENMIFVYVSLLIITFTFYKISNKINFKNLFNMNIFSSNREGLKSELPDKDTFEDHKNKIAAAVNRNPDLIKKYK